MGEARKDALRVGFDSAIKLEYRTILQRIRQFAAIPRRAVPI
jgi:hypothetical protein